MLVLTAHLMLAFRPRCLMVDISLIHSPSIHNVIPQMVELVLDASYTAMATPVTSTHNAIISCRDGCLPSITTEAIAVTTGIDDLQVPGSFFLFLKQASAP